MNEQLQFHHPWFVAVWPGMGNVAVNAGVYLLAKMSMELVGEADVGNLFDIDHVEVKAGLIQSPKAPRNRFFVWRDPQEKHDLVVFLGEAQPPLGKFAFCRELIALAKQHGAERVFTFAAMATQMHPEHRSRVFGAATDQPNLNELKRLKLEMLEDSNIGGLNGVLLGAAAEAGLSGVCLLGEMPHIFAQIPYPKASLSILEAFATMTGIQLDLSQLSEQAATVDRHLGELLERVQRAYGQHEPESEGESYQVESPEEDGLNAADQRRIDALFEQATQDRAKAFELKQELDRLGIFKDFEDRFLDLFKKSNGGSAAQ